MENEHQWRMFQAETSVLQDILLFLAVFGGHFMQPPDCSASSAMPLTARRAEGVAGLTMTDFCIGEVYNVSPVMYGMPSCRRIHTVVRPPNEQAHVSSIRPHWSSFVLVQKNHIFFAGWRVTSISFLETACWSNRDGGLVIVLCGCRPSHP